MDFKKPFVAACGGANCDISIKIAKDIVLRDSNPGQIKISAGGVARNVAESLTNLGVSCVLLSAIGQDDFAKMIIDSCEKSGIDTSCLYIDETHSTGCYVNFLDKTGDMYVASSDMGIIENIPGSYFSDKASILKDANAIFIDANLMEECIKEIIKSGNKRIFADPVSAAKANRLLPFIGDLFFIKPNLLELQELSQMECRNDSDIERAAESLLKKGLTSIAVSLGEQGCYYANANGKSFFCPPEMPVKAVSATGCGDAFVAGFIKAILDNLPEEKAAEYAQSCSLKVLLSEKSSV